MTTEQRLKTEAKQAATTRGHNLVRFYRVNNHEWWAHCRKCGMSVFVDTNPPPNGIDISGEAVALNCNDEGQQP